MTDIKKRKFSVFKLLTFVLLLVFVVLGGNFYINYSYNKTLTSFKSEFNQCNFNDAKDSINTSNLILSIKKSELNSDLKSYFLSVIDKLSNEIKNGTVTSNQALVVFNEIKTYNILDSSLDKLIISLDENYTPTDTLGFKQILEVAIQKYTNKDYLSAITLLNKIPETATDYYSQATSYIDKSIADYKTSLFTDADKLVADDYYTKAIELLTSADSSIVSTNDSDIQNKINSIIVARDEYLAADALDALQASTSLTQAITVSNINTLNIESSTAYLVYVNLANQMTYIYKGSKNDWSLDKEFSCSTGISGEDTPKGIFSITSRGDWFFSQEYDQGGKYWVQFMGDYLFHSVPFDESGTNIVDTTLGTPASHGCIRLAVDDAKYLYDNISDSTKVIIN